MQSLLEQLHNFFLLFNKMFNFHTSSFLKKEQANAQPSSYTGLKATELKIFLLPPLSSWTQPAPTRRKEIIGLMQAAYSFIVNPNTWEKNKQKESLQTVTFSRYMKHHIKGQSNSSTKTGRGKNPGTITDVGGQKKTTKSSVHKRATKLLWATELLIEN